MIESKYEYGTYIGAEVMIWQPWGTRLGCCLDVVVMRRSHEPCSDVSGVRGFSPSAFIHEDRADLKMLVSSFCFSLEFPEAVSSSRIACFPNMLFHLACF